MKTTFFIIALFAFISCTTDPLLHFHNNTNRSLVYECEIVDRLDTIPDFTQCDSNYLYRISPNSVYTKIARRLMWKRYFQHNPSHSVHIYVADEDTLLKYGTCEVLKKRFFLKTYNINYEDAVEMNWTINFNEE